LLCASVLDCIRQAVPVCFRPWLYSSVPSCIRHSLAGLVSPWLYSSVPGCVRQAVAAFVRPWLYSSVPVNPWQHSSVPGCIRQPHPGLVAASSAARLPGLLARLPCRAACKAACRSASRAARKADRRVACDVRGVPDGLPSSPLASRSGCPVSAVPASGLGVCRGALPATEPVSQQSSSRSGAFFATEPFPQ